jgi:hypothetical protein
MLDFRLAVAFFGAGFIAAYFGCRIWAYVIKLWNKRSIIVFLLASYVALATIAMTILSLYELDHVTDLTHVASIC